MNLKHYINENRVMRDVTPSEILNWLLVQEVKGPNDSRSLDQVKFGRLADILGRLVEYTARTDSDTLQILGAYQWEVDYRTDEEMYREQMKERGSA